MSLVDRVRRNGFRLPALGLFVFALATTDLRYDNGTALMFLGALLGVVAAAFVVAVWGERTRPQANLWWTLITLAVLAGVAGSIGSVFLAVWIRVLPLAFYVSFFMFHDHPLGPSLALTAVVGSGLAPPDLPWSRATEAQAWILATAVLAALLAALLERERLQALQHAPTPLPWTIVRGGFFTLWTVLILTFKQQLQVGQLFARFGADPRGEEGRFFLLAIILVCLAISALLFRQRAPRSG